MRKSQSILSDTPLGNSKSPQEEKDFSQKYKAYRVREDPKTRYRYVTEILNIEEGKSLVNRKWAQILICQQSLIKNPLEDFKRILDEAERKMLKILDSGDQNKANRASEMCSKISQNDQDSKNDSSSSDSDQSNTASQPKQQIKRNQNMGLKRVQNVPSAALTADELAKFERKFPNVVVCGKASEYYKVNDVLDHIKSQSDRSYKDINQF